MAEASAVPADAAAELYALPLDEFIAARNALAARLKKAKQPLEAEAIRKLPKPSLAVWALDQVAHGQPQLVERLLAAGEALRQAQQELLAGRNAAAFRTATEDQKAAIQMVVQAAGARLEADGHPITKTTQDRFEATLRAVAADPAQGQLLRRGVLAEDLNPAGFGGLEAGFSGQFSGFAAPAAPAPSNPTAARPTEGASVLQARAAVNERKRQLEALRAQAAEAERDAAAARQAAHKADLAVNAARRMLEEAEREADNAHRSQLEASEALDSVRRQIDDAADQLAEAEHALASTKT